MPNLRSTSSKINNPPRGRQPGDDSAPSRSTPSPQDAAATSGDPFAALPTETEIYILPGGEIVIADLPAELAGLLSGAAVVDAGVVDAELVDAELVDAELVDPTANTPDPATPTSGPQVTPPATPAVPTAGS
ncbi:MAG: hypothetical protein WDZ49_09520 [Litorilinea sp.]